MPNNLASRLFWLMAVAGCSQQTMNIDGEEYPAELAQATTVTVSEPGFQPTETTTFHWYMDVVWGAERGAEDFEENRLRVKRQIETEFGRKGYRVATGEEAKVGDYVILAVVVLGKPEEVDKIMEVFRLYPDLGTESKHYETGTLILAIAKPGVYKASWRGAITAFADTSGELPVEIREARIAGIVRRLMRSIPGVK